MCKMQHGAGGGGGGLQCSDMGHPRNEMLLDSMQAFQSTWGVSGVLCEGRCIHWGPVVHSHPHTQWDRVSCWWQGGGGGIRGGVARPLMEGSVLLHEVRPCTALSIALDIWGAGAGLTLDRDFLTLHMCWTCPFDTLPNPTLLLFVVVSSLCPCIVRSSPPTERFSACLR